MYLWARWTIGSQLPLAQYYYYYYIWQMWWLADWTSENRV
jgi:hypothetical protein